MTKQPPTPREFTAERLILAGVVYDRGQLSPRQLRGLAKAVADKRATVGQCVVDGETLTVWTAIQS